MVQTVLGFKINPTVPFCVILARFRRRETGAYTQRGH